MKRPGFQSGQAAVLAALCLFTCVVFLAMATNMGILVNDRIRMQNTADLTAYAGAFEQARNLNEMAKTNKEIWTTINECRHVLSTTNWTQCDDCECNPYTERDAEAVIAGCVEEIEDLAQHFVQVNQDAPQLAYQSAIRTAGGNMAGTDNTAHFTNYSGLPDSPTYVNRTGLIIVDRFTEVRINYQFVYCCRSSSGHCSLVNSHQPAHIEQWDGWFFKTDPVEDIVYFPARVNGTPMGGYLDLRYGHATMSTNKEAGYFGNESLGGRNPLSGYAAAKPFEGNIGPDWATSEGLANILQGWVYDNYSAAQLEPWFRARYRARVAGLNEPLNPPAMDLISPEFVLAGGFDPRQFFTH